MILCIGTTPAAQRVMVFHRLTLDAVNRATTTLDGAAGKSVNVAKVLQALGEHPVAAGFLGGDRGELRPRGPAGARKFSWPVNIFCLSILAQSPMV